MRNKKLITTVFLLLFLTVSCSSQRVVDTREPKRPQEFTITYTKGDTAIFKNGGWTQSSPKSDLKVIATFNYRGGDEIKLLVNGDNYLLYDVTNIESKDGGKNVSFIAKLDGEKTACVKGSDFLLIAIGTEMIVFYKN